MTTIVESTHPSRRDPVHARGRARAALLGLGLAGALAAGAHAADPAANGAQLYHDYCSVCHGDRGDGRSRASGALSTPPRDFTTAASKRELTRARIVLAITYGRPGTAMVGWTTQLSSDEIEMLADHLLARFVRPDAAAVAPAQTPP